MGRTGGGQAPAVGTARRCTAARVTTGSHRSAGLPVRAAVEVLPEQVGDRCGPERRNEAAPFQRRAITRVSALCDLGGELASDDRSSECCACHHRDDSGQRERRRPVQKHGYERCAEAAEQPDGAFAAQPLNSCAIWTDSCAMNRHACPR